MARYGNLDDKARLAVVREELEAFNKLVEGHRKLLMAIGKL